MVTAWPRGLGHNLCDKDLDLSEVAGIVSGSLAAMNYLHTESVLTVERCDSKNMFAGFQNQMDLYELFECRALDFVHDKEPPVCETKIHVASCNGAAPQPVNKLDVSVSMFCGHLTLSDLGNPLIHKSDSKCQSQQTCLTAAS